MVKTNVFEHKGYQGSVEASIEDNCLHGKILHISDLVTYEANSIAQLKEEFEAAVDDYLETCTAIGKQPEKAFNGVFNVRVSPALHKRVAMHAAKAGVTLNSFVATALEIAVEPAISRNKKISVSRLAAPGWKDFSGLIESFDSHLKLSNVSFDPNFFTQLADNYTAHSTDEKVFALHS